MRSANAGVAHRIRAVAVRAASAVSAPVARIRAGASSRPRTAGASSARAQWWHKGALTSWAVPDPQSRVGHSPTQCGRGAGLTPGPRHRRARRAGRDKTGARPIDVNIDEPHIRTVPAPCVAWPRAGQSQEARPPHASVPESGAQERRPPAMQAVCARVGAKTQGVRAWRSITCPSNRSSAPPAAA